MVKAQESETQDINNLQDSRSCCCENMEYSPITIYRTNFKVQGHETQFNLIQVHWHEKTYIYVAKASAKIVEKGEHKIEGEALWKQSFDTFWLIYTVFRIKHEKIVLGYSDR